MSRDRLTPEQQAAIKSAFASGITLSALVEAYGCTRDTILRLVDHRWRERRNEGIRRAREHRNEGKTPAFQNHVVSAHHRASKDEAAARLAEVPADTRSLTSRLAGDPLPGRSALDRRARP
jgi:hypothetical protein